MYTCLIHICIHVSLNRSLSAEPAREAPRYYIHIYIYVYTLYSCTYISIGIPGRRVGRGDARGSARDARACASSFQLCNWARWLGQASPLMRPPPRRVRPMGRLVGIPRKKIILMHSWCDLSSDRFMSSSSSSYNSLTTTHTTLPYNIILLQPLIQLPYKHSLTSIHTTPSQALIQLSTRLQPFIQLCLTSTITHDPASRLWLLALVAGREVWKSSSG